MAEELKFDTENRRIRNLLGLLRDDKTLLCGCTSHHSESETFIEFDLLKRVARVALTPFPLKWWLMGTEFIFFLFDISRKPSNEFTEYQHRERRVSRNPENDRVHSLDTVSILEFKGDHNRDVEDVFIHYGGYADEVARSHNAFAITMANHIYFRNSAYNPHSEEGRKLLAHELTHVAQHKEGMITKNANKDDLEIEAEQAESIVEYDDDPIMTVEIYGNRYRFRRSKMKGYAKAIANDIKEWMVQQKAVRSDESYLKLLCRYEKWLKRPI